MEPITVTDFIKKLEAFPPDYVFAYDTFKPYNFKYSRDGMSGIPVTDESQAFSYIRPFGYNGSVGSTLEQLRVLAKRNPSAVMMGGPETVLSEPMGRVGMEFYNASPAFLDSVNPQKKLEKCLQEANEKKLCSNDDFIKLLTDSNLLNVSAAFVYAGEKWYLDSCSSDYPTLNDRVSDLSELFTESKHGSVTIERCKLPKATLVKNFSPRKKPMFDSKELLKDGIVTDDGLIRKETIDGYGLKTIEHVDSAGVRQGPLETYHTNGKISIRSTYKDGKCHGSYEQWRADGSKLQQGTMCDYIFVNEYRQWNADGSLYKDVLYDKKGMVIKDYLAEPTLQGVYGGVYGGKLFYIVDKDACVIVIQKFDERMIAVGTVEKVADVETMTGLVEGKLSDYQKELMKKMGYKYIS